MSWQSHSVQNRRVLDAGAVLARRLRGKVVVTAFDGVGVGHYRRGKTSNWRALGTKRRVLDARPVLARRFQGSVGEAAGMVVMEHGAVSDDGGDVKDRIRRLENG